MWILRCSRAALEAFDPEPSLGVHWLRLFIVLDGLEAEGEHRRQVGQDHRPLRAREEGAREDEEDGRPHLGVDWLRLFRAEQAGEALQAIARAGSQRLLTQSSVVDWPSSGVLISKTPALKEKPLVTASSEGASVSATPA